MSRRRRTFSFMVLALLLLCTAVFLDNRSEAAAIPNESQQAQDSRGTTEREPAAPQAAQLQEITGLRTADSKTFELADGNREWVGYTEPVHYKDGSGTFQEIDNSIVGENRQIDGANFAYRNAANEYTARFGATANATDLVSIEHEGNSVVFGPVGVKASNVKKSVEPGSRVLSGMAYAADCVTYPDVYPGIDLVYEAKTNGIKEYLVLREPGVKNEFTFNFKLRGLKVAQTDGRITFVDNQGDVAFWLGTPIAFDDAEVPTNDVAYEVKNDSGGSCQVKVTLSQAYLDDPDRVFPVVLDPEVVIYPPTADTYVASTSANNYYNTNFSGYAYLRTGRDGPYGIRRTFIKFTDLPAMNPDDVTDAHLRIEKSSGVTPNINAWRSLDYLVCESMTWNTGTPYWNGTTSDRYADPMSTTGAIDSGNWYHMHATSAVQYWLRYPYLNYGWMIKDTRESDMTNNTWTTFYSSNMGSPHRPELHILYNVHVVDTKLACDGLFRNHIAAEGGSWSTAASNALETADDAFASTFNIDFNVLSTPSWNSPIDSCSAGTGCSSDHSYYSHLEPTSMMEQALTNLGMGTPAGTADVMVCITGAPTMKVGFEGQYWDPCPGMNRADGGDMCIVVHDYSYDTGGVTMATWKAMQHELGHSFGDSNDPVPNHWDGRWCVMNIASNLTVPFPDMWCSSCKTTINAHRSQHSS
jgi:hypothetical protein